VCGIVRVISDEDVKNIKCDINSSILKTMQLPKEKKWSTKYHTENTE
jgi:hypothetical protein